jgi:hypothetical protein
VEGPRLLRPCPSWLCYFTRRLALLFSEDLPPVGGGLLGTLGLLLLCSLCAVAEALLLSRATRKSRGRLGTPALFGPTLTDVGLTYDAELALRTGNYHLGPKGLALRNSRADAELPAESQPAVDLVRTGVARVRVGGLIFGRSEGRA